MATVKDLRGREIVVNVGHGEDGRDQSPAAKRRKGSPQTSKARDGILHRRTKKGIEFFDLAQTKQFDVWVTNNYAHFPSYSIHSGGGVASDELRESDHVTLDIVRAFEADVLGGTAPADFETHFRKVPKSAGNAFKIVFRAYSDTADDSFTFTDTNWTDKGLAVAQSILTGRNIQIHAAVAGQDPLVVGGGETDAGSVIVTCLLDTNPTVTKCTAGNTFESDEVTFHALASDKWFLFPRFAFSAGYSAIPLTDGAESWAFCNLQYLAVPRDFDNPSQIIVGRKSDNPANYATAVAFHRSFVCRPEGAEGLFGSRVIHVVGIVSGPIEHLFASGGGSFPLSGDTALDDISFENLVRPYFNDTFGVDPRFVGQLLGICKRGTDLLYFWRRVPPIV
jgi:hypothetical protein